MSSLPQPDLRLDVSGKFCPVPVIEMAKAIKSVGSGQVIELLATDPGVESDFPAWCRATRNELVALVQEGRTFRVFVRHGPEPRAGLAAPSRSADGS